MPKTCRECDDTAGARGFCQVHYMQWYHGQAADDPHGYRARRGCLVEGCEKMHHAHGYCRNHSNSFRTYGDPITGAKRDKGTCSIEGCDKPHSGRGYCKHHYNRFRYHGDPLGGTGRRGMKPRLLYIPEEIRHLASGYAWAKQQGREPTPEQHQGLLEYHRLRKAHNKAKQDA